MRNMILTLFIGICLLLVRCSSADSVKYTPVKMELQGPALEMMNKVNELRAQDGVPLLVGEVKLHEICLGKAQEMSDTHTIDHSGNYDRFVKSGATCMGECLTYNYLTVNSSFLALYDSKLHQKTLTNPNYTHFGYAKVGQYECLLVAGYSATNSKNAVSCLITKKGCIISSTEL